MEPATFAVALGGAVLYAAMTVGSTLVVGRVTDQVVAPAFRRGDVPAGALAVTALVIVGVALAKALGIVLRRSAGSAMALRLHASHRRALARQYLRLPLAWHRRHPTGELLSTVNADVEAAFAPIYPLPFACGVLLLLASAMGVLVATDPPLALVGIVLWPALAVVNTWYNRRSQGPASRAQELRGRVSAIAHESVDGALVVKTLGREADEAERLRAASERLRDELVELGRIRSVSDPLTEALPALATLVVLVVGALRVGAGAMTLGDLVTVAYLFTLLAFPVRMIGFLLAELPRSVVGWERITRVLGARADGAFSGRAAPAGAGPARVDVRGVTFRHGDHEVLRDVDLDIAPGRTVALVGRTGAGKSTLAALLVRLSDPDAGAVRLDGVDLREVAPAEVARHAALVFQEAFLFDDTVRGNVTLGEPFPDEEVTRALRLAQADGFVRALPDGPDTLVGERGASLSGGQRQRLALARALVRRPRLLVLDDATSSVDPAVEAAILAGLRGADGATTLVVVAYRRATIAIADEVVFLDQGRVLARGRHAELLARVPAYAALVSAYEQRPVKAGAEAQP